MWWPRSPTRRSPASRAFTPSAAAALERLAGLRGDKGTPGISVDLREGSVDIDITMSIVFGANVPTIAEICRKAVTEQVEGTTGLKVRAVNVLVTDVIFPEEQPSSDD